MANKKKTSSSKTKKTVKSTKTASAKTTKASSQKNTFTNLRNWNIGVAVLLALQAIAIILIGKSVTLPVVTHYLTTDALASQSAGHTVLAPAVRQLFTVDIRYIIASFLLVSAVIYGLLASLRQRQYDVELKKRVNSLRWLNLGLSGGLMLVLIAMLNGVYDSTTLLAVFVLIALVNFLGFFTETRLADWKSKLQLFITMCVAGGTAWLIVFMYLKGNIFYGNGLNKFVYWIDGLIFVLTLGLAYNKLQSFRGKGRWSDYLFGERLFVLLNFVALTATAWLVFAGFLK